MFKLSITCAMTAWLTEYGRKEEIQVFFPHSVGIFLGAIFQDVHIDQLNSPQRFTGHAAMGKVQQNCMHATSLHSCQCNLCLMLCE